MANPIVKIVVKEMPKDKNMVLDFYNVPDEEVKELFEDTVRRVEQNNRKTVQSRDL